MCLHSSLDSSGDYVYTFIQCTDDWQTHTLANQNKQLFAAHQELQSLGMTCLFMSVSSQFQTCGKSVSIKPKWSRMWSLDLQESFSNSRVKGKEGRTSPNDLAHSAKIFDLMIAFVFKGMSYFYKEMGVHVLDAVIRDWLEAPPPPLPLWSENSWSTET